MSGVILLVVVMFLWKLLLHTQQQTVPIYGKNYLVSIIAIPVLSILKDLCLHLVVGTERSVVCPPSSAMYLKIIPGYQQENYHMLLITVPAS